MNIGKFIALSMAAASLALPVSAGDVYVIAHNGLALAHVDVKEVFIGDKQIVGGTKVVPMDNASLQGEFLEKVMNMDAGKYGNIWTKKGFRDGLNPPPVKSGDSEVISSVKSTSGAVGYVSSEPVGVKVIKKY
jgi:hypothetical protein